MDKVLLGAQVAGTVMQASGQWSAGQAARIAGERQRTAAQFEAAQLEQAAGQSVAAGQRAAIDEDRRAKLIASRALAVAAASGAGAADPTVVNIIADISGEGAYRRGLMLYQGEERARQLRLGAASKIYEGDVLAEGGRMREQAYRTAGFGSLLGGGASLFSKYGDKKPNETQRKINDAWVKAINPDM